MKAVVSAIALLWSCLSIELAQPDWLPSHCLLLPAACAVMYWFGNGTGVLIAGCGLLIDWVARPTSLPLVAVFVPALAVLMMTPGSTQTGYRRRRRFPSMPASWRLPLLTILALVLHLTSDLILLAFDEPSRWWNVFRGELADATIIASPLSVLAVVTLHVASELGFRRTVPWSGV